MAEIGDLLSVVGRLKRAMPRHGDVLELDRLVGDLFAAKHLEKPKKGPFDKKAYQRELMRKRRALKKKAVVADAGNPFLGDDGDG